MGRLFSDFKGHRTAVFVLSAQLKSGNLGHAYIILGEEGTGRVALAKEFARYLLCEDLSEKEKCQSCRQTEKGVHPDLIMVPGSEGIKIEEVRTAIERINLSPSVGGRKVLLLLEAQNMGIEAANALLKTLEEPPKNSVIVMTAISEKSLPQTIISRVQKLKLSRLSQKTAKEALDREFGESEVEKASTLTYGNMDEVKKMILSPEEFQKRQVLVTDIKRLVCCESICEKFRILDDYEKAKALKTFFSVFSQALFSELGGEVRGQEGEVFASFSIGEKVEIARKVLKINEDLDYNVNLRLALEEIILENA